MSKAFDSEDMDIHVGEKGDDHLRELGSDKASPETPQAEKSTDADGEPIYSMYLDKAKIEDERTAEGWKKEAEQVFLFTGLFSAVVATFISLSIPDIRADRQDTSNFYLASIHQALTSSNVSDVSFPSSPPPFTPPMFGIWVNSLWFLSLVINMTCAVLANLLQQWARKYIQVTQPHFNASKTKQARYCAYYADGVENFYLPMVFEALPALLHLSVFLFFAGLVVFLWNVDATISKLILSWVAGCVTLYGYITFIPLFRHDSPYNTPLSPLAWSIRIGIPFLTLRILRSVLSIWNHFWKYFVYLCCLLGYLFCFRCEGVWDYLIRGLRGFLFTVGTIDANRFAGAGNRYRKELLWGMRKTAEKHVTSSLRSKLSGRAFMWTFERSHEDERETFFSNLPGFCSSKSNDGDFLGKLTGVQKENLWGGLIGFLDETFTTDWFSEDDRDRRAKICAKALEVDPQAFPHILESVISEDQCAPVQSAQLAHFIGSLDDGKDLDVSMLTQAIVSCVVATAQRHDDKWFDIASKELDVDERVLRKYTEHDLSLAALIHVTCHQLRHFKVPSQAWPSGKFARVLRAAASNTKVQQASPELQHGFCSLWNKIVDMVPDDEDTGGNGSSVTRFILEPIYKVFADIHQLPATASSRFFARAHARPKKVAHILDRRVYPQCAVESHLLALEGSSPQGPDDVTFASIRVAALAHSSAKTLPALAVVTSTAPGASPAMSLATEPGTAAEDDMHRAHLAITTNPRLTTLPSIPYSKGAEAGRSVEPDIERDKGDRTPGPPVSHHGDDIV